MVPLIVTTNPHVAYPVARDARVVRDRRGEYGSLFGASSMEVRT